MSTTEEQRYCEACGTEPIFGRRTYCKPCARERRNAAQMERDRSDRARRVTAHETGPSKAADEDVVDYTQRGNRPPSPDVVPRLEPERPVVKEPLVITDGRVESPAVRQQRYQLDYSAVPGWVRRDHAKAARMAAQQNRAQDSEQLDFNDLEALQRHFNGDRRMVEFHAAKPQPQPRTNAIGQSIPRARG
jgi:hypothetical protein